MPENYDDHDHVCAAEQATPRTPGATAGTADALGPDATGCWEIRTRSTVHVLDLDAGTYQRQPGPGGQRFDHDAEPAPLTRVEIWPRVGQRMMVWFDDSVTPAFKEHYRVSSTIQSITPRRRTTSPS